jgi:hypothetical protein
MKRQAIIAVILLLAAGATVWWFSPTQVVKRRTSGLLDSLTFSASTGSAYRQASGYGFSSYLAESVELDNPTFPLANGVFDRGTLEAGYSGLANQARESRFDIETFDSITVDGDLATVRATVEGLVQLPDYRPADGRYEVEFHWQKESDGNWRLTRAVWREAR